MTNKSHHLKKSKSTFYLNLFLIFTLISYCLPSAPSSHHTHFSNVLYFLQKKKNFAVKNHHQKNNIMIHNRCVCRVDILTAEKMQDTSRDDVLWSLPTPFATC